MKNPFGSVSAMSHRKLTVSLNKSEFQTQTEAFTEEKRVG